MKWLVRTLVDNGWVRTGMSFRWLFGTNYVLTALVNEKDLKKIEGRYNILQQAGFFSGSNEVTNKQRFIKALFARDLFNNSAFSKSLKFAYHPWDTRSAEPFSLFIGFIRRVFFQGPSADRYKQTFIESVFHQQLGEGNALASAALVDRFDWIENPTAGAQPTTPFQILLEALADANCFHGTFATTNKQQFLDAVFKVNNDGKNIVYEALQCSRNFTSLLEWLTQIDYSSEENIKTCIEGILHVGKYGSVLGEAMENPSARQWIVTQLRNMGCFTNERYKKAFIDAVVTPSSLVGRNALFSAAHISESLEIMHECLKEAGCFSNSENKQKLINAMLLRDRLGNSTLLVTAARSYPYSACVQALKMLRDAGCFDGSTGSHNQQAFVDSVFAEDDLERSVIDEHVAFLKLLNKMHYFEGQFGERNKQKLIDAVLKPKKYNNSSILLDNCSFSSSFALLIEHLTAAGCFSGSTNTPNKKAFIDAVLSKAKDGTCVLSRIYHSKDLIVLLEKLADAGCFDESSSRKKFLEAVRSDGNAVVFHSLTNLKSYLALHKCLVRAGCSPEDIRKLLNESVGQKHNHIQMATRLMTATPLMMAMTQSEKKNDILIARLIHDGAILTDMQKQQLTEHDKKYKKPSKDKEDKAPFDKEKMIADAKKRLTAPAKKPTHHRQEYLDRRGSFSASSLFAKKPPADAHSTVDDIGVGLRKTSG